MLYYLPGKRGKVFLVVWIRKQISQIYLRYCFKPFLAEHYRFLENCGFLVVYLKPRFGLKLKTEVLVNSYFDFEDEAITEKVVASLKQRGVKLVQDRFASTEMFLSFARQHLVLKANPWVKAELDSPEIRELVADFC